jgi:hypothetical protein
MPDNRTQLNIKIDAKTHWLANLAARHWGMTLAEFVESLIAQGITREAMLRDEPKAKEPSRDHPGASSVLWNEALWSEDEATRLFNLATTGFDLLTESQRKTWALISSALASEGKKLTAKNFRQHYELLKDRGAE